MPLKRLLSEAGGVDGTLSSGVDWDMGEEEGGKGGQTKCNAEMPEPNISHAAPTPEGEAIRRVGQLPSLEAQAPTPIGTIECPQPLTAIRKLGVGARSVAGAMDVDKHLSSSR